MQNYNKFINRIEKSTSETAWSQTQDHDSGSMPGRALAKLHGLVALSVLTLCGHCRIVGLIVVMSSALPAVPANRNKICLDAHSLWSVFVRLQK